jgi:hypothetical protein
MYMKRNLLTFGILAVAMLLPCVASAKNIAGYPTVDGWDYTVYDDGTAELISAPGATGSVVVPDVVTHNGKSYTVTCLGGQSFNGNKNITAIQLPSGLKELGGRALAWCENLETVTGGPEALENIYQYNLMGSKWMENQPEGPVYFKKWLINFNGKYEEDVFALPEGTIGVMQWGVYKGIRSKVMRVPASTKDIDIVTIMNDYDGMHYLERFEVDKGNTTYFNDEVGALYKNGVSITINEVEHTGVAFVCLPKANPAKVYNVLPGTKFLTAKSLNNRSLEQFNAPEGVVYVGNEVFRFNSPKGVDLPSTVLKLYDSFYVAEGVETIALRATAVPEHTNDLFYKCPNATLYVPDASVDAYKAATAFAVVKQILPLSQYSAVKDVTAAETSAEVTAIYGIDGSVRTALQPGINIVRYSDGTARKVMHRN